MTDDLFNDDTFLARWLAGALTEEELVRFREHPDFLYYKQLADSSSSLKVPELDQANLLKKIKSRQTNKLHQKNKSRSFSRRIFIPAAAMLFLIVSYFALFNQTEMVFQTAIGEQLTHTLPDASTIYINAKSKVIYDPATFTSQRKINLDGEAFFEVEKGTNFLVETKNGQIEVLGTSFSVYSRDEILLVSCKTGSVKVQDNFNHKKVLQAGQRLRTVKSILQNEKAVAPHVIGGWKNGQSYFDSEHFGIVIKAIEHQFGVSIKISPELEMEKFTGSFLHKDLETAFKMVLDPMGLNYKQSVNGVYIIN